MKQVVACYRERVRRLNVDSVKARLMRDGFVRVPSVLTAPEVAEVRNRIDRIACAGSGSLDSLGIRRGFRERHEGDSRRQIEVIRPVWLDPALRNTAAFLICAGIADYCLGPSRYWFDHLIKKPLRSYTVTEWHQDEASGNRHDSVNRVHFWIPLQDVPEEAGAMQYVPGSHRSDVLVHQVDRRRGYVLRSISTPQVGSIETVVAREGDVFLHLPRTVHAATENRSDRDRLAWILHFTSQPILSRFRLRAAALRAAIEVVRLTGGLGIRDKDRTV